MYLCDFGIFYLCYSQFALCNCFPILLVWSVTQKQTFFFFKLKTDCYKPTKSGQQSQLSYQKLLQL